MRCQVYLVPGFFGFTKLGGMNYFLGVSKVLREALAQRGLQAEVFDCSTKPTASIRRRAEWLLDEISERGGLEADELHFVGHSTGGLDLRLMLTPGVRLREGDIEERVGATTRSCVTVSTPHYGTPLAGFFTTLPGRRMLELLSVLATTTGGRYGLYAVSRILKTIAHLDDYLGRTDTFLDAWAQRALSRVSRDPDDPMWEFLREVAADQGAIIQLTPESMNLFNAAVIDRERVRYASVVTAAPSPLTTVALSSFIAPAKLTMYAAFALLYALASREHRHYPYPHPGEGVLSGTDDELGFEITRRSNDGVVPALSQIYGQVLDTVASDHLDVVGQYDTGERHTDWLPSGSDFHRQRFERVWGRVADWILDSSAANGCISQR